MYAAMVFLLAIGVRTPVREGVRTVVAGRSRVPPHPVPANAMARRLRFELAPQLRVLHRLAVARAPAVLLPGADPRLHAVLHVLRIGVKLDLGALRQRFERADHRDELHPVVGRLRLSAEELFLAPVPDEKRAPAARSGVALAGAVSVDDDRPRLARRVARHATAPGRCTAGVTFRSAS